VSSLLRKPDGLRASFSLAVLPNKPKIQNVDDGLIEYAAALEAIDENNPLAELNAVSISDNNGGRIFL